MDLRPLADRPSAGTVGPGTDAGRGFVCAGHPLAAPHAAFRRAARVIAMIRVTDLMKSYQAERGPVVACDHASFDVDEGRFFTLLGPSGSGKTTTLRCVAGLERPAHRETDSAGAPGSSDRRGSSTPPSPR